jgi:uncharacterized protein (DUF58 family)
MRLSYRLYRLATALQYRIPRRLTRPGLLAASAMIMTGAIGVDVDQSLAFQAFALLFCLLAVSVGWTLFFRGRFAVERVLPRMASVGQPFGYTVRVRNLAARSYQQFDILEDLADPRPGYDEFRRLMRPKGRMRAFRLAPGTRPSLDCRRATVSLAELGAFNPNGTSDAQVQVTPLQRGPLRFESVTVARRDPLGLVRAFATVRLPGTVLVLPKRYRIPAFALPGTQHYEPGGVALASSVGESEEFVSLRDYRPGDPFRRIHWRSWARAGKPIVKEYQNEFFVRYGLVLDSFIGANSSELFEEAVSVAASFACSLERKESLLDLLFVGTQAFCLTTGRGLGESERVLELLASVQSAEEDRFDTLRELVMQHASALSGCICVLLDWDEPRKELVRRLREQGIPVLVLVVAEQSLAEDLKKKLASDGIRDVYLLRAGKIEEDLNQWEGEVS